MKNCNYQSDVKTCNSQLEAFHTLTPNSRGSCQINGFTPKLLTIFK